MAQKNVLTMTFIIFLVLCNNALGSDLRRIAHAGGEYNGMTYTNSFEALENNLRKGFIFFEIDFSWTSDGQLVCIHDWGPNFEKIFAFSIDKPPTLERFNYLVKHKSPVRLCTLATLSAWLKNNPSVSLVTDIKRDNVKGLQHIEKEIDNYKSRVIPQIYQPDEYDVVNDMGFKRIIWTLYKFQGSEAEVMEHAKIMNLFAVTMPPSRAEEGLAKRLDKVGISTYTHTINNPDEFKHFLSLGIDEIYTDFLSPANMRQAE